ncbi:MAG: methylated-DNA--[protein]-cysteine S-methyltransferase, partial [Candidatus Krumholzibacteria bacterium]|nr:methylated-DNA--[protein]-cysteine S-methyltransferase [Candidatus Krumholzibacteria bacterium]
LEALDAIRAGWPQAARGRSAAAEALADRIAAFLEGEPLDFPLEGVDMDRCSPFQRRVLVAEHSIPRGSVATYGGIAAHLGSPAAGRAVGRALATNPFPIVVPCHRAIRSDGSIGGYQGGPSMKRILLEREGVVLSSAGFVEGARVAYGTLAGRRPG